MSVFTDRVQRYDPFYYISKQLCMGTTPQAYDSPLVLPAIVAIFMKS